MTPAEKMLGEDNLPSVLALENVVMSCQTLARWTRAKSVTLALGWNPETKDWNWSVVGDTCDLTVHFPVRLQVQVEYGSHTDSLIKSIHNQFKEHAQ